MYLFGTISSHSTTWELVMFYDPRSVHSEAVIVQSLSLAASQAIRRYKAAITLIHGLCQHAESPSDRQLLSECLRMIRERHGTLWAYVSQNNEAREVGAAGSLDLHRGLTNYRSEPPPPVATQPR